MTRKDLLNVLYNGHYVVRSTQVRGMEMRYDTSGWQRLYYCKACTRTGFLFLPDKEDPDKRAGYMVEVLQSYNTIIALAIKPRRIDFYKPSPAMVIIRFGVFSNTSTEHFHKWVHRVASKYGPSAIYVANAYDDKNRVSTYLYNDTTIRYRLTSDQMATIRARDYIDVINSAFDAVDKIQKELAIEYDRDH